MGGIEFSPKVQHQRDRINLWKHVISKKQGGIAHVVIRPDIEFFLSNFETIVWKFLGYSNLPLGGGGDKTRFFAQTDSLADKNAKLSTIQVKLLIFFTKTNSPTFW